MLAAFNTYATLGGGTEWFALDRKLRKKLVAYVEAL